MKKLLFLLMIVFIMTGCGGIDPSKVNKQYVKKEIEDALRWRYGTEFVVNIVSFDKNSIKKESVAEAYPNVDSSLKFEIKGSLERYYFSGNSGGGYMYQVYEAFDEMLINPICSKYSFEIVENADYNLVANNVRNYLKEVQILLVDYKYGTIFDSYFDESSNIVAEIPFTINGQRLNSHFDDRISIDRSNGKVFVDTGEMELEEYLRLLATKQTK